MERYRDARVFLSGRFLSLLIVFAFQLLVVRLLEPAEYGRFALVVAWSLVAQIVLSFGVQRLIPKYLGQIGNGLAPGAAMRMVWGCLLLRFAGSSIVIVLLWRFYALAEFISAGGFALFVSALCYVPLSMAQADADSVAQALGLQRASRRALLGESTIRLTLTAGLGMAGLLHSAAQALLIAAGTAALATLLLIVSIIRFVGALPRGADDAGLDWREVLGIAAGGYTSAMAWFSSSPPIARIIASRDLPTIVFAGFSFMQTLVLSFQRYTPATLMLPFIEPLVLRQFARQRDVHRLETTLSLLTKVDLIAIGAAVVGCVVAGQPLVALMTGGRYAEFALILPFVLAYVSTTSIYRTFEIVAVALQLPSVMVWSLIPSVLVLVAAVWLAPQLGLIAILGYPLVDAAIRLLLFRAALGRRGVHHVLDIPIALATLTTGAVAALAGLGLVRAISAGPIASIAIGAVAALTYLAIMLILRPLRQRELVMLDLADGWLSGLLARFVRP